MNPREILENNYNGVEGSFTYFLHEESKFDKDSFWEYYNCINDLAREGIENGIDRDISKKIIFTYRFILESFIYHFAPKDLYKIKKFPKNKYTSYLERLKFVVDGYFSGYVIDESKLTSDLKNRKV